MDCVKRHVPVVGQSWTAANWPNSKWRSSWGPRRSDTPADYGPPGGYGISSRTKPGCDTMRTTSGASCASLTGLASGPLDGRWSVTRRASATGRNTVGRRLKKSPARRAHDHLHRRKRIEPTTAPSADLGAARTDGTAISLQLEGDIGCGRNHLVANSWWSGTGCRRIGRGWSASSSGRSELGSRQNDFQVTPRNSIQWSTSGATGNTTSSPISAPAISLNSATRLALPCAACAAANR